MFKGIQITKDETGYRARLRELEDGDLPEGNVAVGVEWSTLNYKDALAITGRSPVVRRFPLIAGIDFAGTVLESAHPEWRKGDKVILNGWGVGETHSGGLAGKARVAGDWLVRLPEGLSCRLAMAVGTAGYTAMLCVMALEKHGLRPGDGDILVTGAAGGVGSVAVSLLSKLGYRVIGSTGRLQETAYLESLGVSSVIDRAELSAPGKPLAKERWAGAVDTVGGVTLANACAATRYRGAVAACGLAGGMDFPATVAPFILRSVTLYGIDSVMAPLALRKEAWARLAVILDRTKLDSLTTEIALSDAIGFAEKLLAGQVRGRLAVRI